MISQKHRFHGQKGITRVYRQGMAVRGAQMTLKYLQNQRSTHFRVAVVVSRKVHKSAVVRNRIRRRLYEIIRELSPQITKAYDLVIVVYSEDLAQVEHLGLKQEIQLMLQKADIV
jgi:ribonuclease P protein component